MYRILVLFWEKKSLFLFTKNRQKAGLIFLLLYWYAASGFLYFELPEKPDLNWLDAMWWALVTMTTVGYGDYFPVTAGGRYLVGIPTMIFGIGFLGFIISEVSAQLIETRSMRTKGMADVTFQNHILIINFSRLENVLELIKELKADRSTMTKDICLVDETLAELPTELVLYRIRFVRGNPTRAETLIQANVQSASHAVILSKDPADPHSDDLNLAATLVIEDLNPEIFSIVEVIDPGKVEQIELAGCDSAVCVSKLTTNLVIQELQDPGVKSVIHELTSNRFGLQIYFTAIKEMRTWKYQELVDWGLTNNLTVLGLQRDGNQMLNCPSDETIMPQDKAIIVGKERLKAIET